MLNRFSCRKSTTTAELEGRHLYAGLLKRFRMLLVRLLCEAAKCNKNRALKAKKAYSTP